VLLNSTNLCFITLKLFEQIVKAYELTVSTAFRRSVANISEIPVRGKIFSVFTKQCFLPFNYLYHSNTHYKIPGPLAGASAKVSFDSWIKKVHFRVINPTVPG
jgi:hypothetical protein